MPTENVNKADNLIDVGEADQESTEINLDNKGEPEKVEAPKEEKIEVEEVTDVPVQEDKREQKVKKKKTRFKNIVKAFKNVSLNLLVKCEKQKGKKKKPLLTQMQ